jgi:hypothetical protein
LGKKLFFLKVYVPLWSNKKFSLAENPLLGRPLFFFKKLVWIKKNLVERFPKTFLKEKNFLRGFVHLKF